MINLLEEANRCLVCKNARCQKNCPINTPIPEIISLYKENKSVNQTAIDMKLSRSTIWRIKNEAQEKIMKKLLGGNKNV